MTPAQINAERTRAYVAARARWAGAMAGARGILEAGTITGRFRQVVLHGPPGDLIWDAETDDRCHLPHVGDFNAVEDAFVGIFDAGGPVDAYLAQLAFLEDLDRHGLVTYPTFARRRARTHLVAACAALGLTGWAAAVGVNDYRLAVPAWEAPDA